MENEYKSIQQLVDEGAKVPFKIVHREGDTVTALLIQDDEVCISDDNGNGLFVNSATSRAWKLAEPTKESNAPTDALMRSLISCDFDEAVDAWYRRELSKEERSCNCEDQHANINDGTLECRKCGGKWPMGGSRHSPKKTKPAIYSKHLQLLKCESCRNEHIIDTVNNGFNCCGCWSFVGAEFGSKWEAKEPKPDPVEENREICRDIDIEAGTKQWEAEGRPWDRLKKGAKVRFILPSSKYNGNAIAKFLGIESGKAALDNGALLNFSQVELHPETYASLGEWLEPLEECSHQFYPNVDCCIKCKKLIVDIVPSELWEEDIDDDISKMDIEDCLIIKSNDDLIKSIAEKPIEEWARFIKNWATIEVHIETAPYSYTWEPRKWMGVGRKNNTKGYYTKATGDYAHNEGIEHFRIPATANKLEWIAENVDLEGYLASQQKDLVADE